jgi:hypothetical protein
VAVAAVAVVAVEVAVAVDVMAPSAVNILINHGIHIFTVQRELILYPGRVEKSTKKKECDNCGVST